MFLTRHFNADRMIDIHRIGFDLKKCEEKHNNEDVQANFHCSFVVRFDIFFWLDARIISIV